MKLFALLWMKEGRGGGEEKFTILTTTSLGAWQNKLFFSDSLRETNATFRHLAWFLSAWLLPRKAQSWLR